ncbi:MAG: 5-(carboxyamino)imidazole ribonucleotide mutase, partial [Halobacteria archaeon]|nr:5-(carboxyamino)imidazole ribonucleotide mutase [Halobacteria archaeon]
MTQTDSLRDLIERLEEQAESDKDPESTPDVGII